MIPAPTELVARLRGLLAKTDSPNGHDWLYPWRVVPSDGKPIIASNRGGNLFRGFIGTWDEADLVVEAVNALPAFLDLIEAQAAEIAALREALAALVLNIDAGGATLGAMADARAALAQHQEPTR